MPEEGALPGYSQAATYLLHLIERGLVDAHLLKVILRGLDHLVDDLAVDIALDVPSALPWPCCWRARGLLTTITFDMAARSPTPSYLLYGCNVRRHGAGARLSLARRGWKDGKPARRQRSRRQTAGARALKGALVPWVVDYTREIRRRRVSVRRLQGPHVGVVGCNGRGEANVGGL
jgi:hypothetical protein